MATKLCQQDLASFQHPNYVSKIVGKFACLVKRQGDTALTLFDDGAGRCRDDVDSGKAAHVIDVPSNARPRAFIDP